jgi:hypothetical protein
MIDWPNPGFRIEMDLPSKFSNHAQNAWGVHDVHCYGGEL